MRRLVPMLVTICFLPVTMAGNASNRSLQVAASLARAPANITLTEDGRIFVSLHQFFAPKFAAAETDGGRTPGSVLIAGQPAPPVPFLVLRLQPLAAGVTGP
jgi:hypothetical protein